MKEYQSKLLLQMHSFRKVKFWKLVPELSPSEHMLINSLCICESGRQNSGKCGSFSEIADLKISDMKGVKVSELARSIHIPMSGVSRMLASLEERGIIERRVDLNDRRNTLVFFTENGFNKAKEYRDVFDKYLDAVFEKFGKDKATQLMMLLEELSDVAKEELDKIPDESCVEVGREGRKDK